MYRSSGDKHGVARGRDDAIEVVCYCPVAEGIPQIAVRCTWLQAGINATPFLCLNHNPGFGLAHLARWKQFRMRIAGMNLHGEHFACVKKLKEQRKTVEARSQLTHNLRSILFHQSTDG